MFGTLSGTVAFQPFQAPIMLLRYVIPMTLMITCTAQPAPHIPPLEYNVTAFFGHTFSTLARPLWPCHWEGGIDPQAQRPSPAGAYRIAAAHAPAQTTLRCMQTAGPGTI
ncbi:hypothetical protein RHS01_09897 [Rhizoctonia solani]|uniref:Uncharacterized protein n=1 Tax=Rhizoctonia solani TaxID=456999 RepID=A0A8H7I389_9AGAM|nr:hypothetical protein RHS01_09897 [Rhizoctonia solani]